MMPNFLDAPELPLPSLQTYTSISVLLLSCSIYYAFSITSDLEINKTASYDDRLADMLNQGQLNDPEWNATLNSAGEENAPVSLFQDYYHSFLDSYGAFDGFKKFLSSPEIYRLIDIGYVLISEPLCVWTLINMSYCCLILFGKLIQKLVFGPLRQSEQQLVRDKFWNFLLFKLIFVFSVINVQFVDELILWCGWFSILGFMLVLTYLCRERFTFLASSPSTFWPHARLLTLLVFIAVSNIPLFIPGIAIAWSFNFSIGLFLIAEALLQFLRTLYCIAGYVIYFIELRRETSSDNRTKLNYYMQLFFDLIILVVDLLHHFHMLFWSHIIFSVSSLLIGIQLKTIYSEIVFRIKKHLNFLEISSRMDRKFPIATASEIEDYRDFCAICREAMTQARKLPCGHLYHPTCILSWLEQHLSCPICRLPLSSHVAPENARTQNAAPGPENQNDQGGQANNARNHFFFFDGSRYARWLPTVTVELRAPSTDDINAFFGQRFFQRLLERNAAENPTLDPRVLEQMTTSVNEWFPQFSRESIRQDLLQTRSIEQTMENIMSGRFQEEAALFDEYSEGSDNDNTENEFESAEEEQFSASQPGPSFRTSPESTASTSSSSNAQVFRNEAGTSQATTSQTRDSISTNQNKSDDSLIIDDSRFNHLSSEERKSLFERRLDAMFKKARDAFLKKQETENRDDVSESASSEQN